MSMEVRKVSKNCHVLFEWAIILDMTIFWTPCAEISKGTKVNDEKAYISSSALKCSNLIIYEQIQIYIEAVWFLRCSCTVYICSPRAYSKVKIKTPIPW